VRTLLRARTVAFAAALLAFANLAFGQSPGILLVAKPSIVDPNFARTVIAVAQAPDGAAIGVILNRPLDRSLAQLLPGNATLSRFTEPLRFGGPVEAAGLFALYRSATTVGDSLVVAEDLRLALLPPDLEQLIKAPPAALRFYAGYAGWAPGQLVREIERGDWWVLDVDTDLAFRSDTRGLWEELSTRAGSLRAAVTPPRARPGQSPRTSSRPAAIPRG
jgi:putative transcriptional regulator